jgi:hypothetical protein
MAAGFAKAHWEFKDPKLEVPTIYIYPYIRPM